MTKIHKTAVVSPKSNIDPSVEIGAPISTLGSIFDFGDTTAVL